jgi:hypothetical protein
MIFYDFWRILKDLYFYIKKRKIEKCLRGLGPAHNETDPTTRIQLRSKMKPTTRGSLDLDILHQNL